MFYPYKEKVVQGVKVYLKKTPLPNSWWIEYDFRNSYMVMKHFEKYSEAIKFYNSFEENYVFSEKEQVFVNV